MTSAKTEAEPIRYPKHWFAVLAIVFESVLIYWLVAALADPDTVLREFWLVVCPVAAAVLFLFLVPPLLTSHLAGEKALRLRMGLLINQSIPYEWVREVRETSVSRGGVSVGIGVRYFPISGLLFITSGFTNVAQVRLDGAHELGGFRKRNVECIVLSVSNMPRFLEIMHTRIRPKGVA